MGELKPQHFIAAGCFIGATIVACTGHDGWGWLIFAGLMVL